MLSSVKKILRDNSGVAAVEFALIVPILIMIMIGIMEYGIYLNKAMKVENAARASAQYVIEGGNKDDIITDIILPSNLGLDESNIGSVTVNSEYVCECAGGEETLCSESCGSDDYLRRFIEVSISMDYSPMIPYPRIALPSSLSGAARLQVN